MSYVVLAAWRIADNKNPCKRCLANGTECVFEKPATARTSNAAPGITDAVQ